MALVYGFLRRVRRHGWRPGGPVDPDYGIDEGDGDGGGDGEDGELPEVQPPRPPIPKPPVGIWPPLRPEDPWRPVPPEGWEKPSFPERPGQGLPPTLPPGGIPQPPGGLPQPPAGGIGGRPPERPGGGGAGDGEAGQLPTFPFPPGAIFPPLPPGVHGKYLALVLVGGMPGVRYRYVVIDADARFPEGLPERPDLPAGGLPGRPPQRPGPGPGR